MASVILFCALGTFAHAAGVSALTTAPWQQNVYTNRFTIFCETKEVVSGMQLQYGSGYGQSVEMTCVPGDSDGTTQHYIYKGRANLDSVSGVIGSLVSYRIVAGGAVLKCPDGSDAAGAVWVWKDVPNERLSVALWSDNQVGAKDGDYDLDRFAYIKAAFGRMVAHDVDFGISTGDMTTSGSYADQTRPCILDGSGILGRTRPYYVCFGNHDDYVAPDEMNKRYFETGSLDEPAYGTSERGAYYFYRGNVLFIFLHWPHDNQQGDYSVYRTWLQDLLATPRAKQAKFRLLFSHKPMFLEVWSEGSEGRNYDTSLYDTAVAGGVDMVVSGHMHGYERTVTDKGLVQLVNGGMGSLDHKEHVVNNYGDWTKMGGHRNIPYLWARQSAWKKPTLCGYFPVNMGCITSYCEMKIDGGELNVQAHGFCANGDYIGVFDDFTLVSKTDRTPPTPRRAVTAACADPSSFDAFVNTPVTNAKWKEYKDAVDEDFAYAAADASKPVVNVSKDEITRFCAWLNNGASGVSYRLPTEAELRAKRTNLAGSVTEWTSTVDQETGWCRILGGNALASNTVWTATGDKPAIASSACHANYLGFRLVKESGTEVVVTIKDWTGRKVQTVRGVTTTGTFALDVADYFNATVDYVTAFDGGTVSAAPSSDVVSGSVVTWTGVDRRLETEVFVQPRVPYKNFAQYNMGDPWVVKDPAANVWYVTSTMANDGLSVRQTTEFPTNRFGSSKTYRLKDHSEFGDYKYYIWAPEIHFIQGRWYAYLSASSNSGSSNYERPFVLTLPEGLTPYSSQWQFGAKLVTPGGDRWAIDGTILDDTANGGKLYYVWSGWPSTANGVQNLYLAEMATPTSFASGAARIQISTPTESWETLTTSPCKVNEGPAVLRHGDAVHIVYSCNGCWTDDYSLALLTCTDGNFANPASWKKSSSRIFVSRPGAYGPGHCSFTRTADGQDMIVYHAKNVSGHSSDYYNYRDIRMQPIAWHGDTPVLGVPRPYDDTLTADPLDLNADYYKEGPDVPPPPSPTDYGAPDKTAITYTWKPGVSGPWAYTTSWTPGANATYGIPNSATYATAAFPAGVTAGTRVTVESDASVKQLSFANTQAMTLALDNATLAVAGGNVNTAIGASGSVALELKGTAQLTKAMNGANDRFFFGNDNAIGTTTITFVLPSGGTPTPASAMIVNGGNDNPIKFGSTCAFTVDARALAAPGEGMSVTNYLAYNADGVRGISDTMLAAATLLVPDGTRGELISNYGDPMGLVFILTGGATPTPPPGPEAYDVTLETLLDEMCDADAATRLAALPWTGRLWSSYDRASVSTNDLTTWYANNDRSQFVRTETRSGRTECVMVDAKGPGALTRLWTANGYGTIYRFYVDGASEPVISGVGTNLVGGHVLCGAPLADEVSLLQPPAERAQDLYLPITFAQSLVVTAELKDIPPDDDPGRTLRLWYNAEVRTYAEGTRVEPFSSAVLARAQDAIAAANAALRSPSAPVTDETKSLNGALAAGASRSVTFTRTGGAIRSFSLKLADGDEPLRTVRVKITFDGETTVDAAVGQLFGAGYAATPYATVNGGVAADGTLTFRQVMPFASSCTVTLENTGRSSCSVVASSVAVGAYDWDDARSLHFGALGFEERELPTRRGAAGYYDLPWVKLEGQGQLVGNTLMLDNSQSDQWWGEGDEKIYIDGETFPSYFGTGTEDFFGYAWGHGKAFTAHPFLALPLAGEGLTGGRRLVTTVRTRRLDVVPFATSLKLDVEIWHWEDCAMDYAPATFWYARPGVKVTPGGRGSEPEPPPVDPTAYGAADKKAATYTWKAGVSGPWEYTTQWTPGASATYGIPSHKTYATANFPASLAEATTCTLSSDRSVKNALFDSPNLTFVIDNATLTVANVLSTDTWGAYNFGNTATGEPKLVFRGAAPGLYESTPNWRSNFGCLAGGATGLCTVRFEVPAGNWAAAPIRTAATESKVCFWENVKFEIDATALGVPAAETSIVVPLAASSDGVFFMADNFEAVMSRSAITCASGATGQVVISGNDLQLVVTAREQPEFTLTAPDNFAAVPLLNDEVKAFNALSSEVKSTILLTNADNAAYREQLSAAYKTGLPAVTLAWDGTEGQCGVKVWRECDGKKVLDTTSTTRTAVFWDAEIGRNYRWSVTCGGNSATGYFHTESEGPRLINEKYGQIANVRDLGGWATADGLVVRQGVLFRTGSFGALTGTGAPYFTGTLGIRQDVDLRPEQTIIAEDVTPYGGSVGVSPLGASVPRYCSDVAEGVAFLGNYADLFKNDSYKQAFWYNFVELNTETKLPAVFHCSAGRDRTGCLAYVIGAVLGVSADDLATDYYTSWASQGWIDRDTTAAHQAKWLPAFVDGLNAAYPPAQYPTLREQAEKYLADCCVKAGGTVAQAQAAIAALRARMLEIPEAPRTAGGKYAVPVPTIASKPANGLLQTADLVRSGFYAVTANAGGVEAGDYPVELTLNDPDNACWADGTVGATKTLTFTIRAGRIAGDRTWVGAAGDGSWTTAENWDPLESPAADEGATVTNAAGTVALAADVTLAKLKLGYDASVRFVNAGGAARTFAVTAQSGSVLGQGLSTLEFSGAGMSATISGGKNVWVKGAVVASDGAKLTLTGYDLDDNSGQVFRATGAGTVFNLDRTLTSNMHNGNCETRFEATDGATLQQSKSQKVPFASTSTSAPQHVYFTGDHGEWMGFSYVTFNGVGVVPHFDLNATTVQVGELSAHGDGVTATLMDGGAVKSGSTLKFSNGGKTATIDVDGWGGIYTKAASAALYLGGSTKGKLTVNLKFAPDAAEKYAADGNLKAVFTTATAGTGAKIYLNSGVTFNVDVTNFASAKEGSWKFPLCYQAQTGDYGKKILPTGDYLKVVNAGAQADRYAVACAAEGQYVYLTLTKAPGADPIPDEIANGKSGDPITIPPGAAVDLSNPKRLVVDGAPYDVKEHYVFARTEAGGVMLAIDPDEAEIAGISIAPDGTVTVVSGKAFEGFRYALEGADNLAFEGADTTQFQPLDERRTLSVVKNGDRRFYRLVVTDKP